MHHSKGPRVSHHRRRVFPVIATAAIAAIAAVGLTSCSTSASSGSEKVTLNYWTFTDYATGTAKKIQLAEIAEFEKKNPNIKVNLVGKDAPAIITGTAASAGQSTGPDVITTQLGSANSLVNNGVLLDLKSQWKAAGDSYTGQFNSTPVKSLSPDGHVYGVPYTAYSTVLYRNLTVLKAAGVDTSEPISDWSTWLEQMEKVHATGAYGMTDPFLSPANGFLITSFYAGVPGRADFNLNSAGTKVTLTPSALASSIKFLQSTKQYGSSAQMASQAETDLFTSNKLAFIPNGPWLNATLQAASGLQYDAVAIPGQTSKVHGGTRGGEFLAIPAASKNQDAAWKFVRFMTDESQMNKFAVGIGRLVANKDAMSKSNVSDNALLALTSKVYDGSVSESPLLRKLPANVGNALANGMVEADKDGSDPTTIANEMVDNYNKALQ